MQLARIFILLLALAPSARAAVSSDDWLVLGDAAGGDCALSSLVFDKVHKKGQPRSSLLSSGKAFLNDYCDLGNLIMLAANGQMVELKRESGTLGKRMEGTRLTYVGSKYRASLTVGNVIESFYDAGTGCHEGWYKVSVSVESQGRVRRIDGTLVGGCP